MPLSEQSKMAMARSLATMSVAQLVETQCILADELALRGGVSVSVAPKRTFTDTQSQEASASESESTKRRKRK